MNSARALLKSLSLSQRVSGGESGAEESLLGRLLSSSGRRLGDPGSIPLHPWPWGLALQGISMRHRLPKVVSGSFHFRHSGCLPRDRKQWLPGQVKAFPELMLGHLYHTLLVQASRSPPTFTVQRKDHIPPDGKEARSPAERDVGWEPLLCHCGGTVGHLSPLLWFLRLQHLMLLDSGV